VKLWQYVAMLTWSEVNGQAIFTVWQEMLSVTLIAIPNRNTI
jgi:hypothetical protein